MRLPNVLFVLYIIKCAGRLFSWQLQIAKYQVHYVFMWMFALANMRTSCVECSHMFSHCITCKREPEASTELWSLGIPILINNLCTVRTSISHVLTIWSYQLCENMITLDLCERPASSVLSSWVHGHTHQILTCIIIFGFISFVTTWSSV